MNTCEKCGAYIPIGETACPACGYDPKEQEKRAAEEARRKAAEEARRKAAEAEAEKQRAREEQQRRAREEQQKAWQQGGAQYAYQSAPKTEQTWSPPWEEQQRQQPQYARPMYYRTQPKGKAKNKWVAFGLCLFTGWFGGHKFYEEKYGAGLLYMFTSGLFGVGWLLDLVHLAALPEETYYVE